MIQPHDFYQGFSWLVISKIKQNTEFIAVMLPLWNKTRSEMICLWCKATTEHSGVWICPKDCRADSAQSTFIPLFNSFSITLVPNFLNVFVYQEQAGSRVIALIMGIVLLLQNKRSGFFPLVTSLSSHVGFSPRSCWADYHFHPHQKHKKCLQPSWDSKGVNLTGFNDADVPPSPRSWCEQRISIPLQFKVTHMKNKKN